MTFTLPQCFDFRLARYDVLKVVPFLWNLGEVEGARAGAILGMVPPTYPMAFLVTMFVLLRYIDIRQVLSYWQHLRCLHHTSPEDLALTKLGLM
ncbi:uncharacterized protein ARMOST_04127 [Armillaria ostoyae]|uniref:Uncharacterized protein n=1 Tax=Armillaria ostoyae TaxID=47428 RepID=A0A284QWH9_ARMOS|nr:uncharacterized protein ARMOST_04127 [Armillaria ostoyae]